MAAKRASGTPKKVPSKATKTVGGDGASIVSALEKALASLASALELPAVNGDVDYSAGTVSVRRSGDVATANIAAPRTLVSAVWREEPGLGARIWTVPAGQWDLVRRALQCNESVQTDWLALVDAIRAEGTPEAIEQAQLVWMHVDDFANTNRRAPRFKALFATLPAVAKIDSASSEVAFVERLLPLIGTGSPLEQLIAALGVLDSIVEARRESDGRRREKLLESYAQALGRLEAQTHPSLRETGRLLRAVCAPS